MPNIVGRDEVGDIARLDDGWAYYVSPCCGASAKGSAEYGSGVCCRACYAEIDSRMGGLPPAEFWGDEVARKLGLVTW